MPRRARSLFSGGFQGAGFCPYICGWRPSWAWPGTARDRSEGVDAEIEGGRETIVKLLWRVLKELPPLEQVTAFGSRELDLPVGELIPRICWGFLLPVFG